MLEHFQPYFISFSLPCIVVSCWWRAP